MPTVFSAHKVLKGYRLGFNNMEDAIFSSLCSKRRKKCTIDHRLQVTPVGYIESGPMTEAGVNCGYDTNPFVCTPVARFRTIAELDSCLEKAQQLLINELKHQCPRRVGSLHVACTVNPSRFCFEIVLAVPFSKEE
jgi:hypothetical protein